MRLDWTEENMTNYKRLAELMGEERQDPFIHNMLNAVGEGMMGVEQALAFTVRHLAVGYAGLMKDVTAVARARPFAGLMDGVTGVVIKPATGPEGKTAVAYRRSEPEPANVDELYERVAEGREHEAVVKLLLAGSDTGVAFRLGAMLEAEGRFHDVQKMSELMGQA